MMQTVNDAIAELVGVSNGHTNFALRSREYVVLKQKFFHSISTLVTLMEVGDSTFVYLRVVVVCNRRSRSMRPTTVLQSDLL